MHNHHYWGAFEDATKSTVVGGKHLHYPPKVDSLLWESLNFFQIAKQVYSDID